jgi:hypothetical protein
MRGWRASAVAARRAPSRVEGQERKLPQQTATVRVLRIPASSEKQIHWIDGTGRRKDSKPDDRIRGRGISLALCTPFADFARSRADRYDTWLPSAHSFATLAGLLGRYLPTGLPEMS